MNKTTRNYIRHSVVWALPFFIAACSTPPTKTQQPADESEQAVSITPLDSSESLAPVEYDAAPSNAALIETAQLWIEQSYFAPPPLRQDLLLQSTAALLKAGRPNEAKQVLNAIDVTDLANQYAVRKRLLRIELALDLGDQEQAARYLARYRQKSELNPEFRAQTLGLSARAYLADSEPIMALHDLIRREQYLTDAAEIRTNRELIWQTLGMSTPIQLQIERQTNVNAVLGDWLDLALLFDDFGTDPYRMMQTLTEWIQINPLGSAQSFASELLRRSGPPSDSQNAPIIKVALLLPLSSKFGAAAQAVQDGFFAMRGLDSDPLKPEVVIFDVGEIPALAASHYQQAISEGANLIIGPLGKQAATAIVESNLNTESVPTILLGGIAQPSQLRPGTYQLDLAPDQEAAQVALRASNDGHRVAAILHPNNDWGSRVASAFADEWETLGGTVATTQVYNDASNDHSFAIKEMLNLNNSDGREKALSSALGTNLEFRPRRRQDLDMIFLVTRPVSGRLIKPQINFYQAHRIPVYSTSHVYTGSRDVVNDTDLNGITFGDMPWLLDRDPRANQFQNRIETENFPQQGLERLFALGIDAYMLSRIIPYIDGNSTFVLHGVSGDRLVVQRDGHIDRQLTWAEFVEGAPRVRKFTEEITNYENVQLKENPSTGTTPGSWPTSGTTSLRISD